MTFFHRLLAIAAACAASATWAIADPAPAATGAAALKARYADLRGNLENTAFGRPLQLVSSEEGRTQKGDVYGVLEYPFSVVSRGLGEAQSWCDVMILPYNTKHCHSSAAGSEKEIAVRIGRKADQDPKDAQLIGFRFHPQADSPEYFRVVLDAADGPLGTRDYRIVLEATPIDDNRTFLHLSYSYGYGTLSKVAMQAYLSTLGASKVGFTTDTRAGELVRGMRGVMERNTMRYALAIEAYLASLDTPREARVAKRLNDWFTATERYPRQLAEEDIDRARYLSMKQREYARMASVTTASGS